MKVVINTCFGGFSLSDEASYMLAEKKGIELEVHSEFCSIMIFKNFRHLERNDPDLVAVVEILGEKANGRCADLKIVEIPDDVIWYVNDYDGLETIDEQHRSWS